MSNDQDAARESGIDVYRIGWTTHGRWKTNVKHLALVPHRPWQAENGSQRFARRAIRKATAARRIAYDRDYQELHGRPSPAQRRKIWWAGTSSRRAWKAMQDRTYPRPASSRGDR